jgi:hypothetical protein
MRRHPATQADAQRLGVRIALDYGVLECDRCARKILQAIGPRADTELIRLSTTDGSDIIGLEERDLQVSETGIHVGVCIGNLVIDNLHPGGTPRAAWAGRFISGFAQPLQLTTRAARVFFHRRFLRRQFDLFVSSKS